LIQENENDLRQKKIRLSQDEKDYIEKIASILGKEYKEVQEVFLGLMACITMDLYSGKTEFVIPYVMKADVKLKKSLIPKGFELKEDYNIEFMNGFHDIYIKIETKQTTWIEEFIKGLLYKELASRIE
jgi:hypothetical protein